MLLGITHGNLDEFNTNYSNFIKFGNFGKLSRTSELRSKKNLAITATTLFTRAAIQGELYVESAYALSDVCIQRIEERESIVNVYNLILEIGRLFVLRVSKIQRKNLSREVFKAQEYIFNHLNKQIVVTDVAKYVGISKVYLSQLFKTQTGITIINFTNNLRIEEAKSQLIYSRKNILNIALSLGFNDQSYFTRIFKSRVGITPEQFKRFYHKI